MSTHDTGQADMAQATADPRAAPFFEQRGPAGVLLLHGYSGTPAELRDMGTTLAGAGYTVHAPLLAGHGGRPDDLYGVRWEDWLASAKAGLQRLRTRCQTVFACGFSAGGLLALHLAAHTPVHGLVVMAPALRLYGAALLRLTGLLRHVMPWYYPLAKADFSDPAVRASVLDRAPEANLDDPAVVDQIRRAARVPVGSLYELARLQDQARRDLRHVQAPTLIMQGRNDQTVDPRSAKDVAAGISSQDRRLVWFEGSGHQLPLESERESVWATARAWLDERR